MTRRRSSRDREDAVHETAQKPSSVFADLWAAAYAASADGGPAPGLHPPEGSDGQERHGQAFRAFLAATFEEKTRSVQARLESAGDAARILNRWRRLETFRDLIPDCAGDEEVRLFVAEIRTIAIGLLPRPADGAVLAWRLSEREWEVLAAMGQGLPTKEIAHRLGIEAETVFQHRKHIVRKTGLSGAALVAYAARLVYPPPGGLAARRRIPKSRDPEVSGYLSSPGIGDPALPARCNTSFAFLMLARAARSRK